jgi:ribosomal protein S12 methylthiotransferase accessory factor
MKIEIDPTVKYKEGAQRVLGPDETLRIVSGILDTIGVTRIADITDPDRIGIPIFSAIRPSAATGAISIYSGKGSDETQARISAIMESVERCCAEQSHISMDLIDEDTHPSIVNTFEKLSVKVNTIHPMDLLPAEPMMKNTRLEWVVGHDLITGENILVPSNAVYHPYTPSAGSTQLFRSNTNGLASGNTMEEAILHGLMEVIERDALSIAEFNKNPGREIILSPQDGVVYQLMEKFNDANITAKLWLLKHDTDLYTAVCALDDPVLKDAALLVMGAGSHLRPEIAVSRALTEAAQSRVVQIHGAREDTDRESMVRTFGYDTMKRLNKYWYEDSEDKVRLSDLEDKSADTPAKNIETIITMLKGIVPYAVIIDLSRSNVKMPVIRAVLPTFELYTLDRDRRGKRMKVGRNKKMGKKKFRRPRPS